MSPFSSCTSSSTSKKEDRSSFPTTVQHRPASILDPWAARDDCQERLAGVAALSASYSVSARTTALLKHTSPWPSLSSTGTAAVRPFRLRGRLEIGEMFRRFKEERTRELDILWQWAAVSKVSKCKRLAVANTILLRSQSLEQQTIARGTAAPTADRMSRLRGGPEVLKLISTFEEGRRELDDLWQRAIISSSKSRRLPDVNALQLHLRSCEPRTCKVDIRQYIPASPVMQKCKEVEEKARLEHPITPPEGNRNFAPRDTDVAPSSENHRSFGEKKNLKCDLEIEWATGEIWSKMQV